MRLFLLLLLCTTYFTLYSQCGLSDFTINTPSASNITSTSVTLSWTRAGFNEGYTVEYSVDGVSYQDGCSKFNGNSCTTGNLTPGTEYFFRVRVYKGCTFDGEFVEFEFYASNEVTVITKPDAPEVAAFSLNDESSFYAKWKTTTSATQYLLDVSTTSDFTSFVGAYHDYIINAPATNVLVTGLTHATSYYYRVRASNSSGISIYSVSTSAITLDREPTSIVQALSFSEVTPSVMTISCGLPSSGYYSGFLILAKANQSPTGTPADGVVYNIGDVIGDGVVVATGLGAITGGVPVTSFDVTSLSPNTKYYYDVFTSNGSNSATNYLTTSVREGRKSTLAQEPGSQPTGVTFSNVSANAMNGSLAAAAGNPSGYLVIQKNGSSPTSTPVDGTTYTAGNVIGDGVVVHAEASLNFTSVSLAANTAYHYDVFSYNGSGESINYNTTTPLEVSRSTLAAQPAAQAEALVFSNINTSSFDASFTTATGSPTGYIVLRKEGSAIANAVPVDGVSYSAGSVVGDAVVVHSGPATSFNNTALKAATDYYFSIHSFNGSGQTINYLESTPYTHSGSTAPLAPVLAKDQVTQSNIKIIWQSIAGATSYEVEISLNDSFSPLLPGYPKTISNPNETEFFAEFLLPSTVYRFRMKALRGVVASVYSSTLRITTADGTGADNNLKYVVASEVVPQAFDNTMLSGKTVSINVSGGYGQVDVFFHYKKITDSNFQESIKMNAVGGGKYSITLLPEWFDEFGIQFFFEATDQSGGSGVLLYQVQEQPFTLVKKIYDFIIPVNTYGRSFKNYQIISIPYKLVDNPTILDLFEPVMLGYDDSRWRFMQYQNQSGKNLDYTEGLRNEPMKRGEGYWFITSTEVELAFSDIQATTFNNTAESPFQMQLNKGWNQIGNPFTYNLSWQEILDVNGNPNIKFLTFNQSTGSFEENDVLKVFSGGFAFAEEDIVLDFPVSLSAISEEGRLANNSDGEKNQPQWFLPFQVTQGSITNSIAAIGMHEQAQDGMDDYDLAAPPAFVEFVEMKTTVQGVKHALSRSMVNDQPSYSWQFTVEGSGNDPIIIRWNKEHSKLAGGELVLYDETNHELIDMSEEELLYLKSAKAIISIHFNKESKLEPTRLVLGNGFPNPFTGTVTIPAGFSSTDQQFLTTLVVYDFTGKKIYQQMLNQKVSGVHSITWNGTGSAGEAVPSGIYLYKLFYSGEGSTNQFYQGRLIKK